MKTRKAHFRGTWYPGDARECEREIDAFLSAGRADDFPGETHVGAVAPHAGWVFSGGPACRAVKRLSGDKTDLVILFGTHLHPGSRPRIMTRGAWETPFGDIRVHEEFASGMMDLFDFDVEMCEGDSFDPPPDNTLEVLLPFVKYFFKDAAVAVAGAPPAPVSIDMGKAAAEICRDMGLAARVLGSTDLTHYGRSYGFLPAGTGKKAVQWARDENDRRVIDAILDMKPREVIDEALKRQNACCAGAAAAAMAASKGLGAFRARLLEYASSHDAQPGDSFVGYAGIVFAAQDKTDA
ncbi:AmmeMemoRadiSam system protein B [Candidatus Desulfarcum epimagneticum]|uniref:AmmeMemoRadiSam system protein B n=1 Tax=uncultured Desulfobacteraceae bacterium TaxID=218296 RepID=A0A484HKZ2_9BACT|nr:AmmeMemoRadiSam system protein B [uncultured Desulfobacteraceae bacterium]